MTDHQKEHESMGDFILLTELAEQLQESASGRASVPLTEEEMALLNRMAAGECGENEKSRVVEMLVSNRDAMEFFAGALKGRGQAGEGE